MSNKHIQLSGAFIFNQSLNLIT